LLNFRDGRTASCREVQTMIEARLTDLDRRARELAQIRAVLKSSLRMCRRVERSGRCEVIEKLKVVSA
ncbi:MAG: MerR family DNA-binding protein, partial [Acidobacteria bacterium]|nr:MerR family DNA-binding protein [Acidobacteriota bacterium]